MLYPPSFLKSGVKCRFKVRVRVRQFKAVVEEGGRLVQLPPIVAIGSFAALFEFSGDDLQQVNQTETDVA